MFNNEELILIKSCLLSIKDFLSISPLKKENMKNKIKEINDLLNKINVIQNTEGS